MPIRAVAFLALCAACTGGWRTSTIDDVNPGRVDERALVVTDALALDLDVTSADEDQLVGGVRAAWHLSAPIAYASPAAAYLEATGDPPELVARRLGWRPVARPPATVAVRRADVRWVRTDELRATRGARIALGVVAGAALLAVALYGLGAAIMLCCPD